MKILIILTRFNKDPYIYNKFDTEKNYSYLMPVGLGYISSVLKNNGHNVTILNLNHMKGLVKDLIKNELAGKEYDFVFTGGVSIYYPHIRDYLQHLREYSPSSRTVIGGGVISAQPEIMFSLLKPDFIIIGEGEQTALELVNCVQIGGDLSHVDGLGYKNKHGELVLNKPRKPIENLDELPYPDFDGFGFEEFLDHALPNYIAYDTFDQPRVYPLLASRSCPFACTFCFHTIGHKYRQRSVKNIVDEIKYAVNKYKINIFFFYDELFAYDKERALEFCRELKAFLSTVPWEVRLNLNLRVDCAEEEVIDAMKDVGCSPIGLGLESFSPIVLKSMRKHTIPEQIERTLRMIAQKNLAAQGAFIFGDPAETLETAAETLNFYNNNQDIIRGGVRVGFVIPFQGSPLYKQCVKKGLIKDEIEFIEKRAKEGYDFYKPMNLTDNLSDAQFKKLVNDVLTAMYTAGHYSIPILSKKVNGMNEIHIKCPYCDEISVLKNLNYPNILELPSVGCRHCNGRFNMVTGYYPLIRFLIKKIGFLRLYSIKKGLWVPVNAMSSMKKRIGTIGK